MVTSKQRREQSRRQLERQLQVRQQQEATRRRRTLIATIAGTVILAVVVVVVVIAATGGKDKKKDAGSSPSTGATPPSSAVSEPTAPPSSSAPPAPTAKGPAVSYKGVTVKGAADLKGSPGVTSTSSTDPKKLEYKDLVVGKGRAATPKATVSVQYTGVLYKNGTEFDSSWSKGGQPVSFPLDQVVPGFTQGIGGTGSIPPMKVGGRRIMILPAALGYGANSPQGSNIPPNSSLVFVVDLTKVG